MHPVLLSGSPILDVDATMLIYIGVFFVLFFILRQFVFRPMMDLFDAREAAIDGAKREARQLGKQAEAKLAAFEQEMAKVRAEVGAERERMKARARQREREILDAARAETDQMIATAEAEMADEAEEVRSAIALATPGLAKQIAQKLLGREMPS